MHMLRLSAGMAVHICIFGDVQGTMSYASARSIHQQCHASNVTMLRRYTSYEAPYCGAVTLHCYRTPNSCCLASSSLPGPTNNDESTTLG